ncbi:universal stress protein [Pseudomonas citronellolis]|uniref:universal stress protein n=1 Tax=Pseudomonas citronellolis TaxID=53408 RepID=UPI0023E353DD|nr:universal stress protein [Pseudomonas citronellolis]MDF3931577.1 universal stress protein [Pseudomonas citronellolis]
MKLQHLLVVVDPTRDDQPALTRAQWIAERGGASVSLLVCDYNPALDNGLLIPQRELERVRILQQAERLDWLEKLAAPLRQAGIDTRCHTRWGKPLYREILAAVAEHQPDLVLKSSSRHGLLKRLFLTNTDWQLIRQCEAPLWLVHHGGWEGRELCAALDPLHESDKPAALDRKLIAAALELQRRLGLRANFLHAFMALPQTLAFDAQLLGNYEEHLKAVEAQHRQALDALLAAHPAMLRERTRLLQGFPEEVIPEFVRAQGIDLLLMGAVARGQLESALIGHTAERVLEEIECDLLVLKPAREPSSEKG